MCASNELMCFMLHILPRILHFRFLLVSLISTIQICHLCALLVLCPFDCCVYFQSAIILIDHWGETWFFCVFFRIFLFIVFIFILWECMCACVCICIPRGAALESSEGTGFPGAGVIGGCRWPATGAGSWHTCPSHVS